MTSVTPFSFSTLYKKAQLNISQHDNYLAFHLAKEAASFQYFPKNTKSCILANYYNTIAEDNTQNNIFYDAKSHSLSFNIKNPTSISIYDTMGKMLINKSVNPNTTHLYINLNSGIYIVNITTQTGQNNCSKIEVK